jgi:hypothetical protein
MVRVKPLSLSACLSQEVFQIGVKVCDLGARASRFAVAQRASREACAPMLGSPPAPRRVVPRHLKAPLHA